MKTLQLHRSILYFLLVLFIALTAPLDRRLPMSETFAQTPASVPCGIVSWWPLDGNANDIKGSNNGTVQGNGGSFPNAMVQKGWKSGGQNSVITVPDSLSLAVKRFSLDFWVRVDHLEPDNMPIIWKGDPLGQDKTTSYGVLIEGTNTLPITNVDKVIFILGNGSSAQVVHSNGKIPAGPFWHITVTADGTNAKIYINGMLDNQVQQTVPLYHSPFPLQIGGLWNSTKPNIFNGVVDEVEFFNRALDDTPKSEIRAIFLAGTAGKCR